LSAHGNNPTTYKELFNLRYSKEKNVIERIFCLLKKRWVILRTPFFEIKVHVIYLCFDPLTQSFVNMFNLYVLNQFLNNFPQVQIINTCCILHNFLIERRLENDARLLAEVVEEILQQGLSNDSFEYADGQVQATPQWTNFRDTLAMTMFDEYQAHRGLFDISSLSVFFWSMDVYDSSTFLYIIGIIFCL